MDSRISNQSDSINIAFPEKTCSIERLVCHPRLVEAALLGNKTEQRRDGVYAYPGETFMLDNILFVCTGLSRERLSDMSDADAKAEGYSGLDAYRDFILRMHKGMQWDDDGLVWVHKFSRSDTSQTGG